MLRIPFVLILNLVDLLRFVASRLIWLIGSPFRNKNRYVTVDLRGDLPLGESSPMARWFRNQPTFLGLRRDLKAIADDPDVKGVVMMVDHLAVGTGRGTDVRDAFDTLRAAGKHVVAHTQMPMMRDYLLTTAADDVLLTPAGRLYTFGGRIEQIFLRSAMEKAGISAQFIHIGQFKTASHRFLHEEMTQPQRLMMTSLLDGMKGLIDHRVTDRRQIDREHADQLVSRAPLDARDARRLGLIDGEVFREDVARWIGSRGEHAHLSSEDSDDAKLIDLGDYKDSRPRQLNWRPLFRRPPRLAIVDLSGMIIMPDMNVPGDALEPKSVGKALKALANDRRVKGVLLHINSPGGSALASDVMWKAIEELRSQKPVVAYCSDVCASGGYYLAVGSDRIICRPETIMGSIGVITGKLSVGETLDKVGVSIDAIGGGGFMSMAQSLTDEEIENLSRDTRAFYRRFLDRVGNARQLSKRQLHRFGRGRVYLGKEAVDRGLADELGGFEESLEALAKLCERPLDDFRLGFLPHKRPNLRDTLRRSAFEATGASRLVEPLTPLALLRREHTLAMLEWKLSD